MPVPPTSGGGGGRGTRWVTAAAAVLLAAGATAIGVAAAGQQSPAEPALARPAPASAAAGSSTPAAASGAGAPASPAAEGGQQTEDERPAEAVEPVSVAIPAIGVDSALLHLGLAADGSLAVPQPGPDYDRAAWFTGSPAPGSLGPAVIEGHIDSAAGGPSVFYRLGELSPGDRITVGRADGSQVVFAVTRAERYSKADFPTLAVYGNTAGPELRLITCGGSFDRSSGHYVDNTVVYAELVA